MKELWIWDDEVTISWQYHGTFPLREAEDIVSGYTLMGWSGVTPSYPTPSGL